MSKRNPFNQKPDKDEYDKEEYVAGEVGQEALKLAWYKNAKQYRDRGEAATLKSKGTPDVLIAGMVEKAGRDNPVEGFQDKIPVKDQIRDFLSRRWKWFKPSIEDLFQEDGSEIYDCFSRQELEKLLS